MKKRLKLKNRNKARRKHRARAKKLSPTKLQEWSKFVRARDGYTCISCKSKKNSHAHHLVSKYYRPQYAYDVRNGVTLCKVCHLKDGGVHSKTPPKNAFIKRLRVIFKLNDIQSARKITEKIARKSDNSQKRRVLKKSSVKRTLY